MTELEIKLLACLREARRLGNQTCSDVREVAAQHRKADRLLELQPELDDDAQRYDAPHRVEHRAFVNHLFRPGRL